MAEAIPQWILIADAMPDWVLPVIFWVGVMCFVYGLILLATTKQCVACRMRVPKKAVKCPHCQSSLT